MMLVQRGDGRPDLEFVIRPQDVPDRHAMIDLVDAAMEAVGLEITAIRSAWRRDYSSRPGGGHSSFDHNDTLELEV